MQIIFDRKIAGQGRLWIVPSAEEKEFAPDFLRPALGSMGIEREVWIRLYGFCRFGRIGDGDTSDIRVQVSSEACHTTGGRRFIGNSLYRRQGRHQATCGKKAKNKKYAMIIGVWRSSSVG